MKERQISVGTPVESLKEKIFGERNDLKEDTFCYELFENGIFNRRKLEELIETVVILAEQRKIDGEIKDTLLWITECVDQCFQSHKDSNDNYRIKNYCVFYENRWCQQWKKALLASSIII